MTVRTIRLRTANRSDEPFVRQVFRDTCACSPPMEAANLDPALTVDYPAHAAEQQARHPRARTSVILDSDEPVGTLTVERVGDRLHLVGIAVLIRCRGRGIASAVLGQLVSDEARVTLSVWGGNTSARRLYERHGFSVVSEQFGYLLMATEAEG